MLLFPEKIKNLKNYTNPFNQSSTSSQSAVKQKSKPVPSQKPQPALLASQKASAPPQKSGTFSTNQPGRDVTENNQAAANIERQNYWQGIYLLDKTVKTNPGQIEPLINLGVALTELGLYGPAARYFARAYEINPQHPELNENLSILEDAGLLEIYRELSGLDSLSVDSEYPYLIE